MNDVNSWSLTTNRLILRHFEEKDWPGFHGYWSDVHVMRYLNIPPKSAEQTRANIRWLANRSKVAVTEVTPLAIALRENNSVIGSITFGANANIGALSCKIASKYWRNGYAWEATERAVTYMFEDMKIDRIEVDGGRIHPGWSRILNKLGFQLSGPELYQLWRKQWIERDVKN
ncbi:N-acetyltransferase [Capsulimonas corticalis]|uniref:N-acetyltransferase n=1 Tax=Capsulimonas corticalis TaxID=2219043 RepID=A0A402D6X5_9BACT|nr:GNAT family N-acetyltransferase [Capsulimonas corticalis]BDI31566.1 N-acetyltransferase [Capsulimonas corticalis]